MNNIETPIENALARLQARGMGIPQGEYDRQAAERATAAKRAKAVDLRAKWNAPKRHTQAVITPAGEWAKTLDALRPKLNTGLLVALVGNRGSGKTQLAVELMKHATNDGRSALFVTAIEFFMAVKATYRKDSNSSEADVIERFRSPKLLVVDEIGKRGQSDWENTLLFELINQRYNDVTDTVVIDNNTRADFTAAVGPSISSRMNECGGIIECNWQSYR